MWKALVRNIVAGTVCSFFVLGVVSYTSLFVVKDDLREKSVSGVKVIVSPTTTPIITSTIIPTLTPVVTKQSGVITKPTNTPTLSPTTKPTTKPTQSPTPKPTVTVTQTPTIDYSKPWQVGLNCPITTKKCVPCTSGSDCRFEVGKTHGFRGWACQNNNPGNIRNSSTNMATDFKNKMIIKYGGQAGCGYRKDSRDGGTYFVFATYDIGRNALKAYIKAISAGEHSSYQGSGWKCGDCSLTQFFSKYAPADSGYAAYVAGLIGEPTSQTLKYVVDNKLGSFVTAIEKKEGFIVQ